MKVLCWNIHMHVDATMKPNQGRLIQTIKQTKPDIILLNEVVSESYLHQLGHKCGYDVYDHWPTPQIANAILLKKQTDLKNDAFQFTVKDTFSCSSEFLIPRKEARGLLMLRLEIKLKTNVCLELDVGVLHLDFEKESDRVKELSFLLKSYYDKFPFPKHHSSMTLLGGDFNAATSFDYSKSYIHENNLYRHSKKWEPLYFDVIDSIMLKKYQFIDSFRHLHSSTVQDASLITNPYSKTRIDYVFFTKNDHFSCSSSLIDSNNDASDHYPLFVTFDPSSN
mmetsp:Transcript_4760/g.7043  ORF Transcript_4760/g.7043 Transcript_4760/m.7043 type:complete len:280 (+) Transcript_4760:849-1688(+)